MEVISLVGVIIGIGLPLLQVIRMGGGDLEEKGAPRKDYKNVLEFWRASRREELKSGMYIKIKGTLSKYGPMIIGDPKLKREKHREFRRTLLEKAQPGSLSIYDVDPILSLTAGETFWRFEPLNNLVYLGLYQGMIRNSIPVFMKEEYYEKIEVFFATQDNQYFMDVELTGKLKSIPGNFVQIGIKREEKPEVPTYGLFVGKKGPGVKPVGEASYVNGDIWVGLEHQGEEKLLGRFLDVSDAEDLKEERAALKKDVEDYLPDSRVIHQFDQIDPLIEGKQIINIQDLWSQIA